MNWIYYLVSFGIAIISGVLSGLIASICWSLITRKVCFPTLEIDANMTVDNNNNRIIKIHNRDSRYGAYDVNCYLDCEFIFDGYPRRYCLASDNIAYIKARTEGDIRVKLPQRVLLKDKNGNEINLIDAFYSAPDGVITVTIVCQNKYGVKQSPIQHVCVKKNILVNNNDSR